MLFLFFFLIIIIYIYFLLIKLQIFHILFKDSDFSHLSIPSALYCHVRSSQRLSKCSRIRCFLIRRIEDFLNNRIGSCVSLPRSNMIQSINGNCDLLGMSMIHLGLTSSSSKSLGSLWKSSLVIKSMSWI